MSDEKPSPGPWELDGGLLWSKDRERLVMQLQPDARFPEAGDARPADAALIADAPAMLELLRALEWSGSGSYMTGGGSECPECLEPEAAPGVLCRHTPDCRLAALLDKHGRG